MNVHPPPASASPALLATPRLRLRMVGPEDAEALFAGFLGDPESVRYLQWRPHASATETAAWLTALNRHGARNDKEYLVAEDAAGGPVALVSWRREDGCRVVIGFVVFRAARRRGYATELVRGLCEFALRLPDVHRVQAFCDVENDGSSRAMEKAGMQREGVLRRWAVHPNLGPEPRDVICFAAVRG